MGKKKRLKELKKIVYGTSKTDCIREYLVAPEGKIISDVKRFTYQNMKKQLKNK